MAEPVYLAVYWENRSLKANKIFSLQLNIGRINVRTFTPITTARACLHHHILGTKIFDNKQDKCSKSLYVESEQGHACKHTVMSTNRETIMWM